MRLSLFINCVVFYAATSYGMAQSNSYASQATISESNGTASFVANDPRPLRQVLTVIQKRYGWAIDYEDPPYLPGQTLLNHGHTTVSGAKFSGLLPAPAAMNSAARDAFLRSLLALYQSSGNPGSFVLNATSSRSNFIGVSPGSKPLLDHQITIPLETRSVDASIAAICSALTASAGIAVEQAGRIDNGLSRATVSIGGPPQSARALLEKALEALPLMRVWSLSYDPEIQHYYLGITPVFVESTSPSGKVLRAPIYSPR